MKNKLKLANGIAKEADLTFLKSKQVTQTLQHILSPLEQVALQHNYQPFIYKLDGARVYISGSICKQLINTTTQKAEFLSRAIQKDKIAKNIPHKLREVFDDPAIVLSLNPSVRNRLCRLECYTLFSIMQRGKTYFIEKGFGKKAMQTLEELFKEHNCSKLFK